MNEPTNPQHHNADDTPNGETHYRVRWEIDIWADTALSAAAEARKIQLDPNSVATIFDVTNRELGDDSDAYLRLDLAEAPR